MTSLLDVRREIIYNQNPIIRLRDGSNDSHPLHLDSIRNACYLSLNSSIRFVSTNLRTYLFIIVGNLKSLFTYFICYFMTSVVADKLLSAILFAVPMSLPPLTYQPNQTHSMTQVPMTLTQPKILPIFGKNMTLTFDLDRRSRSLALGSLNLPYWVVPWYQSL